MSEDPQVGLPCPGTFLSTCSPWSRVTGPFFTPAPVTLLPWLSCAGKASSDLEQSLLYLSSSPSSVAWTWRGCR